MCMRDCRCPTMRSYVLVIRCEPAVYSSTDAIPVFALARAPARDAAVHREEEVGYRAPGSARRPHHEACVVLQDSQLATNDPSRFRGGRPSRSVAVGRSVGRSHRRTFCRSEPLSLCSSAMGKKKGGKGAKKPPPPSEPLPSEAIFANIPMIDIANRPTGQEHTGAHSPRSPPMSTAAALSGLAKGGATRWAVHGLSQEEALEAVEMLRNTSLTSLDFWDNNLGPEGAAAFSEVLKTNTTLTRLTLGRNRLGTIGGAAIAEALKTNSTLASLDLGLNSIGPASGVVFAEALNTNTTLTSLNMEFNELGRDGGKLFAEVIRNNDALTSLNLESNQLGPECGVVFAKALKANRTLVSLNLRENHLGSEGGAALAQALDTNTTLTRLDLQYNQLDSSTASVKASAAQKAGAETTIDKLKSNATLTSPRGSVHRGP